jgi:RNA polymerase sigma factor (sigma-70 family)
VNTYRDLAYTIAMRIVLNKEDAEEVVQDAFLKAFMSLHKFRKAARFSTWLYRIVYNTALTKRSGKPMATVDLPDQRDYDSRAGIDGSQWDELRHTERRKYLDLALSRLSQQDRLVMTMHYIGELGIAEICEIMGMKKSAIKMRLLRSRQQLAAELESLLKNEVHHLL